MQHSEISIQTYFTCGDEYVAASEVEGPLKNTFYVCGFISLDIDGVLLISARYEDLVDQLWAYLVDGLISVKNGVDFECSFPDQPVPIKFERQGNARVRVTIHKKSVVVAEKELFTAMGSEAKAFFEKMESLDPDHSQDWSSMSKRVSEELLSR